ncbi:unnamed protein product [Staurois parvus]|uniref:Uncharacterized protein n=1 Tax=Staurois parvus TaxID=386267 RepID=A0ABN9CIA5_9NEOB|nr:unnamed protein product [Staurois parvus]
MVHFGALQCVFDAFYHVTVQFCVVKMQPFLLFFLHPERTGTASTDVNYDIDNHITYFLCILDAEKSN